MTYIILNWGTDVIGILMGIVFILLQIRAAHTLIGSAFKRYHYWTAIAASFFMLAFVVDLVAIISEDLIPLGIAHHLLLLTSAIIFITTNLSLPTEASQYLNMQSKENKESK